MLQRVFGGKGVEKGAGGMFGLVCQEIFQRGMDSALRSELRR